jgi:hypothetical protein
MIIGVQADGAGFQERWPGFIEKHGAAVRKLDLLRPDWIEQVRGCDGVMWHWYHSPAVKQAARPILHVIEEGLGIPVFPNLRTAWHFDDKIAQAYLFKSLGLPHPETWTFWRREEALAWARSARYPVVAKMSCGAGSSNVRLIRDAREAGLHIRRMFSRGGVLPPPTYPRDTRPGRRALDAVLRLGLRALSAPGYVFASRPVPLPRQFWWPQKDYALFQEFLPDNANDTRVTVVGNRAFAYRRMNRPDDFRASGSGNFDVAPEPIDPRCLGLAFSAAARLGAQSVAFDFLARGPAREPAVLEISYGYVSWMVESCPGHWDRELRWHPGRMWPEEAHVVDFLEWLRR